MAKMYISHDVAAQFDSKMVYLRQALSWNGYGIYWGLVERLAAENSHKLPMNFAQLAWDMRTEPTVIQRVVCDFGLFEINEEEGTFYSERLTQHLEELESASQRRQEAGRKGGLGKAAKFKEKQLAATNAVAMLENVSSNARENSEISSKNASNARENSEISSKNASNARENSEISSKNASNARENSEISSKNASNARENEEKELAMLDGSEREKIKEERREKEKVLPKEKESKEENKKESKDMLLGLGIQVQDNPFQDVLEIQTEVAEYLEANEFSPSLRRFGELPSNDDAEGIATSGLRLVQLKDKNRHEWENEVNEQAKEGWWTPGDERHVFIHEDTHQLMNDICDILGKDRLDTEFQSLLDTIGAGKYHADDSNSNPPGCTWNNETMESLHKFYMNHKTKKSRKNFSQEELDKWNYIDKIIKEFCIYGASYSECGTRWQEACAEARADVLNNGNAAKPFSKKIYAIIVKLYLEAQTKGV